MLDAELGELVGRARPSADQTPRLSPRALTGLLDTLVTRAHLWQPSVRHEPSCRWFGSLYTDDVVDIWLLTWQQDNDTELHDHGGSNGAFRVVEGELAEDRPGGLPGRLVRRPRPAGRTVAFGPGLVHDVRNLRQDAAVSLHAYSPPLTRMNYYSMTPGGLHKVRTEQVEPCAARVPVAS